MSSGTQGRTHLTNVPHHALHARITSSGNTHNIYIASAVLPAGTRLMSGLAIGRGFARNSVEYGTTPRTRSSHFTYSRKSTFLSRGRSWGAAGTGRQVFKGGCACRGLLCLVEVRAVRSCR